MDSGAKRHIRDSSSARVYFVREGVEVCLVLGGLAIADWFMRVPLWVWMGLPIGKALCSILFYTFFLKRSLGQRPRHGPASLVGRTACTLSPLDPEGQIKINGEIWLARSCTGDPIPSDRDVLVREIRGSLLLVETQEIGQQSANAID